MSNLGGAPGWVPRWRRLKDRTATGVVSAGGAGVLVAILLIFFYLVYEILPLFTGASVEPGEAASVATGQPRYMAIEEQGQLALVIDTGGVARFVPTAGGETVARVDLTDPELGTPNIVVEEGPASGMLALAYGGGQVRLIEHSYRLTYPDNEMQVNPRIEPLYESSELLLGTGLDLANLAVRDSEYALLLAGQMRDGRLALSRLNKEENFLTGEVELTPEALVFEGMEPLASALHLSMDQRWLIQVNARGDFRLWDVEASFAERAAVLADSGRLFRGRLSTSSLLLGGISLLAASADGELGQWFVVRNEEGARLEKVREFATTGAAVATLLPEHRRKGFVALDKAGELHIYHSTANRKLLTTELGDRTPLVAAISPRADKLVAVFEPGTLESWHIDNEHPEISFQALWGKVWYESYQEPEYTWQSSASNNDFEPKYSFSPLAFGTLKAAFYAMLIAAPLAICGAIYTAYFMAPALRRRVKPLIELMEALPTVILGFLAGLWLAPFVEANLTGVFSVLLIMPFGVLLFAFLWSRLPHSLRSRVPEGWQPIVLVPVICLLFWGCFSVNDWVELAFFGGDMRGWITQELGIAYDQRNALVVGIAMGMAVIPTIFSISEDAIFSVPKHLSYGSLALGATSWQTLVGVVLPTASPGIFSGLMIGMGRAVGETMIVLMATGNTPIMDANIFEGMRTLAANIAVEVPEAEVDSTHYRVLFLAAFVLFMFTFIVNTCAELVRQRLRVKYGSL